MRFESTESQFRVATVVALCLLTLLAYSNTLRNGFVWDDAYAILLHKHVQQPRQFPELFREHQYAFKREQGSFYRPLLSASFMADFALAYDGPQAALQERGVPDVNPFLFHVGNLFWHMMGTLALFALLTRLAAPKFVRAAAAAIYAVHPLHTEAVAYISGRGDPMAAALMFAGLWFALWDTSRSRRVVGYIMAPLLCAAAILCKESALIFPALLLLLNVARPIERTEGAPRVAYAKRVVPILLAVIVVGLYAWYRQGLPLAPAGMARSLTLSERLLETCQAFALYIRLIFIPTGLHMERTLEGVSTWTALAGALLLLGCLAVLIGQGIVRKRRRVFMGMGWFLLTWFPVSGLMPLNAPIAEHWMYVPLAGFLWALAELATPFLKRPAAYRFAVGAVYAVCVVFTALTLLRNADWRNDETLYLATLEHNPGAVRVHFNLAVVYDDILGNTPGARRHYEKVVALREQQKQELYPGTTETRFWDDELEAHLSLGDIYFQQQQYREAAAHYGVLLGVAPNERNAPSIAMAAFGMGKCLLAVGNREQAGALFDRARELLPELAPEIERLQT